MYEAKRKESPATTSASTSSPESSPLTPGLDAPAPEAGFAEFSVQSATLDCIGAWSAVQPNPPATSDGHSFGLGSDMCSLTNKYSGMHLGQPQPHRPAPTQTTSPGEDDQHDYASASQAHSAYVDYTTLDEAILRGRSTTLPNIFAVPNPLYRFSAGSASAGMDSSALPGPISPVSQSTFSMLSRHGSMSIASGNRAASPLGLPLSANPIHQSASLDNRFTATRDPTHPPAGSNPVPHAPLRRFSEIPAEANSCLALASYSMAPHFASGCDATDGASHGAAGRPAFVPLAISAPTTGNSIVSSLPAPQASACTRYGSFSYHLPTMREEESPSAPLSPPAFADSVLMRNMGFSAMPLPQSGESVATTAVGVDDSSHFLPNGVSPPLGLRESDLASGGPLVKAEIPTDSDFGTGGSYLPLRVKSLKDLRRPSLDVTSDYAYTSEADDQVASAFFERAAERQSSMSLSHLPGLGRRHSLSTSILSLPASTSMASLAQARVDPGTSAAPPPPAGGFVLGHEHGGSIVHHAESECLGYPHFPHSGAFPLVPGPGPGPAAMLSYGPPPAQFPPQPQPYPSFALGSAPLARVPTSNHGQLVGPGMYNPHLLGALPPHQYPYMNHMAYPAPYHHHHQLPFVPAHLAEHAPHLVQPVPVPTPGATASQASQQQQQQQQYLLQQQHMRRASHPALAAMGGVTPAVPGNGAAHSGSHPLLPNPATTITPNMPFADMGKGLPFGSLPKGTRVFVVQFKCKRSDLYFAPSKGMEPKIIPTLAPSAQPIPSPTAPPHEGTAVPLGSNYEPGTYVLVEADRGVDLGLIKEELSTTESILSFSSSTPEIACASNADNAAEQSCSTAAKPASTGESQVSLPSPKDVLIKRIFRVADQREVADLMSNKVLDEQKALSMCQDKVQQRKMSMHIADAEFQFDRRKLTFYFTADRRVDFRELVRELFKHFKTRIWMCHVAH
ncbi:hypothetical protein IWW57_003019 [Coemansia sp. S610]|nr:hypothetical protein IWW57_003019 [Coemansia sp. S610]